MRSILVLLSILLCSCSSILASPENPSDRSAKLYKYAYSSCIFWYLSAKKYDTKDIRSISAGIVETSKISLNVFTEISLFIKDYSPDLPSKNKIDVNLNRCFHLEDSKELKKIIHKQS